MRTEHRPRWGRHRMGAVKRLFGSALDNISMSSTKSAIGHLLEVAGAVEAIYSVKAIQTGIMPPTLNLENVSESCKGIDLIPNTAKENPHSAFELVWLWRDQRVLWF